MHVNVVLGPVSEKQRHPGLCEEFHGHGVGFCRFHGNVVVLMDGIHSRDIALEGVSALMGNHIAVRGRAVKVCKNKRHMILRQHGHIPTGLLILPAENIKKPLFLHGVHEHSSLLRQLVVHLLSGSQNLLRCTCRCRVSVLEINAFVEISQF